MGESRKRKPRRRTTTHSLALSVSILWFVVAPKNAARVLGRRGRISRDRRTDDAIFPPLVALSSNAGHSEEREGARGHAEGLRLVCEHGAGGRHGIRLHAGGAGQHDQLGYDIAERE